MSLNKEMIFGLAFGDDGMKWPIIKKPEVELSLPRNATYTLDKDILLLYFGFTTGSSPSVKIEFPDGQVIEDTYSLYFTDFPLFCPTGTKFTNTVINKDTPTLAYLDIIGYVDYNP